MTKYSYKHLKYVFGCILFTLVFFGFGKIDSVASSFYHEHSDSCYEEENLLCYDHKITSLSSYMDMHCEKCIAMRPFEYSTYYDVCNMGRVPKARVAHREICSVCGYAKINNPIPTVGGGHTYTESHLACTKSTESPIATVSLSASSTAPTNGSVKLICKVSVTDGEFSFAAAPYNFGSGNTDSNEFEVSENGTYSVSVTDARGKSVSASVNVSNIDKIAPEIASITKSTDKWSESGVTITVNASDGQSGLSEAAFSFSGEEYEASNTYLVKKNGKINVKVRDKAGNVSTGSIEIANVGRDPAVIAAEKAAAEKAAAEKAAAEKAAAEKAAAEKAAAEKAAAEKAAAEKAAAEKAAAEKAAAEKAAAQKLAQQKAAQEAEEQKKLELQKTKEKTAEIDNATEEISSFEASEEASEDVVKLEDLEDTIKKLLEEKSKEQEGELILVKDMFEVEEDKGMFSGSALEEEPLEATSPEEDAPSSLDALPVLKASAGQITLACGIALAALGSFIISLFSYIYVLNNGKKKLVCLCRVQTSEDATVLCAPKGKLKPSQRYMVYVSFWKKLGRSKMPVRILVEDDETVITADEGVTFRY